MGLSGRVPSSMTFIGLGVGGKSEWNILEIIFLHGKREPVMYIEVHLAHAPFFYLKSLVSLLWQQPNSHVEIHCQ